MDKEMGSSRDAGALGGSWDVDSLGSLVPHLVLLFVQQTAGMVLPEPEQSTTLKHPLVGQSITFGYLWHWFNGDRGQLLAFTAAFSVGTAVFLINILFFRIISLTTSLFPTFDLSWLDFAYDWWWAVY